MAKLMFAVLIILLVFSNAFGAQAMKGHPEGILESIPSKLQPPPRGDRAALAWGSPGIRKACVPGKEAPTEPWHQSVFPHPDFVSRTLEIHFIHQWRIR